MALSDTIKNIPPLQKLILLIIFHVAIIGGFIYFKYIPAKEAIDRLNKDIEGLNREIDIAKARVMRLPELRKQLAETQKQLAVLKDILPPEGDAMHLLEEIERLGFKTGIDIKSWHPGARRVNPNGLYVELPVDVEMFGGYHQYGVLFDRISRLSQIVNVSNLKLTSFKMEKGKATEPVTFLLTAYASVDKPPGVPAAPAGGGKK